MEIVDQKPAKDQTTITTGHCKAILPDGRIQTVVYTCAPTGYRAVVQYHRKAAINDSQNKSNNVSDNHNTSSVQQSGRLINQSDISPSFHEQQQHRTHTEMTSSAVSPILAILRKRKQDSIVRRRLTERPTSLFVKPSFPSTSTTTAPDTSLLVIDSSLASKKRTTWTINKN